MREPASVTGNNISYCQCRLVVAIGNMATADDNSFSWSEKDIEIMLEAAIEYKSQCEFKGIDWQSVKTKYIHIATLMAKKEVDITKERVAAKMKSISKGYRKAIDSGKRSGGGRVVTMYYDSCRELWKGSPAVNNRCVALRKQSLNRKSK